MACVTRVQLAAARLKGADAASAVAITFYGSSGRAKLCDKRWISIAIRVRPVLEPGSKSSWRTNTLEYTFAVYETETSSDYLLGYHYHLSTGVGWPHLHIRADASWAGKTGLRKAHTATGRFTVEDFIEYLIDEANVEPLNKKWRNVLSKNRAIFSTRRTW